MKRYAVVEQASGKIINIVLWDGVSDWTPPQGCEFREALPDDRIPAPDDLANDQ